MESCPKCAVAIDAPGATECPGCGVILAKALSPELAERRRRYRSLKRHGSARAESVSPERISARRALVVGSLVALGLYLVPFTRFVFSYLAVIVHELGHAAAGYLFGYPSIPSFDFLYGGGVTLYFNRSVLLMVVVGAVFAALVYRLRPWRRLALATAVLGLLWVVTAATSLHGIVLNAAGHGAELLFAGWCFVRVLAGNVRHATERWLYAMCGSFLVLSAWIFAVRLIESEVARREYGQAKGGGHWMDMSRIARAFDADLVPVAVVYWLAATAVPAVAWLVFLNRQRLADYLTDRG